MSSRPDFNRRQFLLSVSALAALGVAGAEAGEWDVVHGWHPDLDSALDHRAELELLLGEEKAAGLEVVRNANGRFGVVYRLRGTEAEARSIAAIHDTLLREAWEVDERCAEALGQEASALLYNVSYGLGPNLAPIKVDFLVVARVLGRGVARNLVVERTRAGNYALVYRRFGDVASTRRIAAHHARLLESAEVSIGASVIEERNNQVVWTGSSAETPTAPPTTPPTTPEPSDPLDMGGFGSPLSEAIHEKVAEERRRGHVSRSEKTSWLIYDLVNRRPLAAINNNVARQCASMVKPLVALAFFHKAVQGRITYGPESRRKFEAMIQHSSNTATDWTIRQVGGPQAVQDLLREHYGDLLPDTRIVEYIGSRGMTYQNRSSASDYARFLCALWRNALPSSSELKRLMNLPGRDRIYSGVPQVPVQTQVYNKTGSTARLCGDMGIVVPRTNRGGTSPYIFVAIIERASRAEPYRSWLARRSKVIREVSGLVYEHLRQSHDLL